MVLTSGTMSVTFMMSIYIRLQTFRMPLDIKLLAGRPRSKIFLQRNLSFGEMLEQVHFSWTVTKYDLHIFG